MKLRPLMIQGTGSSVGKTFLTMALCRIFLKRGYEVAPFKAQNMSLNSAAVSGGEISRAQALQAAAARIDPDVRMNPILLKPSGDRRCQAVVLGRPVGTFDIRTLDRNKPRWFRNVRESFRAIQRENDLVILEGAGSPAEINLRRSDYANMRVARMADAAVLLVGDIDRGGVFASLCGTMDLLTVQERRHVFGFVINKFRGDPSLLSPGFRFLMKRTGRRVFGVIPYDTSLKLPEEDSQGFGWKSSNGRRPINLGLVRTPSIANFTDYDPFGVEPDVSIRFVTSPRDLGGLSAVILPGSKNVFGDLAHLRKTGLADALVRSTDLPIVGICGGLQILGRDLSDPLGVESGVPASATGLGLLPIRTKFFSKKIVRPISRIHVQSKSAVTGYEIHHGRIIPIGRSLPVFRDRSGDGEGATTPDGRVWGTLTHGVFDSDNFRHIFLNALRRRRGLASRPPTTYDLEPLIDRAATLVESHLDLDGLIRVLKASR